MSSNVWTGKIFSHYQWNLATTSSFEANLQKKSEILFFSWLFVSKSYKNINFFLDVYPKLTIRSTDSVSSEQENS